MKSLFFDKAFIQGSWQSNVRMTIQDGTITSLDMDSTPEGAEILAGAAIPAMANVHSHAFQRGFSGLAEYKPEGVSDFWTWRQAMYSFASKMTPEFLEAIAAQLYLECVEKGYSHIGEFHYVHGVKDGNEGNSQEMANALFRAADKVGIGLTFLPAHYQAAGFGGQTVSEAQKKFSLSLDGMIALRKAVEQHLGDRHVSGHCFHSLRAVPSEFIEEVLRTAEPTDPIHIHIAEQVKEVEDCLAFSGQRPVEYLFDRINVRENWCLVHATHLSDKEAALLAESSAVAGLCPTTEANLGDGIFPLDKFLNQGGLISVGSDSHVCRSPFEELRLLEYGQRLGQLRRTVGCDSQNPHVGTNLWSKAAKGGFKALGVKAGGLQLGERADLIVLNSEHPVLVGKASDYLIDSAVFAGGDGAVNDVMINGNWVIKAGCHEKENEIRENFNRVMMEVLP